MAELLDYLSRVVQDGASDLFIIAGSPVCEKLESRLCHISPERVMPDDCERLITDLYEKAGRAMDLFSQRGDDDFSFSLPGLARFRANTYRQRGSMAAVIRVVAFGIPDWKDLGIPEEVVKLSRVKHGMILVTGTAGSGKSTTQACIIDQITYTNLPSTRDALLSQMPSSG